MPFLISTAIFSSAFASISLAKRAKEDLPAAMTKANVVNAPQPASASTAEPSLLAQRTRQILTVLLIRLQLDGHVDGRNLDTIDASGTAGDDISAEYAYPDAMGLDWDVLDTNLGVGTSTGVGTSQGEGNQNADGGEDVPAESCLTL
ncbi:hypothetical protein O1611_g7968 [Lasiodiplodia mahajangana]|uniref:Uncharacterized protein n=1 Tax=Lasiodiplodia mahajangana TaxID=1108764 RepID=A0ACC2JE40_9PEZI|nr:hypothetical protein O1611_g7968 [Lasiodiplodia mahajangana]